jgi:Uma2 family endonuclease
MPLFTSPPVPFENAAELLKKLGGIPPARVRLHPPPGKATEKDVLAINDRENRLFELVDGTLVEKAMGFREAVLANNIGRILGNFTDQHNLGIVAGADGMIRLMKGLVRIPDVGFFSWKRLPGRQIPPAPIPDLIPDLAVEVLSKGNTRKEMERKLKEYFLAGVCQVWFVDPKRRTVRVYNSPEQSIVLSEEQTLDGGSVLPGLELPIRSLFAEISQDPELSQKQPLGNSSRKNSHKNNRR